MMIFRFDDICINSNPINDWALTDYLLEKGYKVIWAVSPLVNKGCGERVYPRVMNAFSDHRLFFNVDKAGIPEIHPDVQKAGHGLWHIDHRLLSMELQEASILTSCSLIGARMFVPPYNKYNTDTISICKEHSIGIAMFEEGWLSAEYNEFDEKHKKWYLHSREWGVDKLIKWING